MKNQAKRIFFWLTLGVLLAGTAPVRAQEENYFLEVERTFTYDLRKDARTGKETQRWGVWLKAWTTETKETAYKGTISLTYIIDHLKFKGETASISYGPWRLAAAAEDSVPMVFLVAIDVSNSMGGPGAQQEAYEQRWRQVESALAGFVESKDNPNIFVRLYPWSNQVPCPVRVEGEEQFLERWEGDDKYLPLDEQGKESLLQGIRDIGTFVQNADRGAGRSLYGVCKQGAQDLQQLVQGGDPRFKKAKPVLLVLSGGGNSPQNASEVFQELSVGTLLEELEGSFGRKASIPVHSIGFGLDDSQAKSDLQDIARATKGQSFSVSLGANASYDLQEKLDKLIEIESNTWLVIVDTRMSPQEIGKYAPSIAFVGEGQTDPARSANDRMLLVPSALAELNKLIIVIALCVSLIVLAGLGVLWYFTRPKEIDTADMRQGMSAEETPDHAPRSGGVTIGEYLKHIEKQDKEDGES